MARFFRRGITKVKFLPTIAAVSGGIVGAPTRAEITAGTDVSPDVAELTGFQLSNSPIPTPNLNDAFTPQISGEDTVSDSSITFYDQDNATTIRTALAKGTSGYLVIFPYGDIATKRCQIYPVKTTGVNDEFSVGNDPARFVVGMAVTGVPNLTAVTPA
jgi:hypothetical protein